MRAKLLIVVGCLSASLSGRPQGTVQFANLGPGGLNAQVHIYTLTGPLADTAFMAQLLLVNGQSVTPVGSPATFVGNGYFNGGVVTISQVAPGATATFLVFAWDSAGLITTYNQALDGYQRGLVGGGYGSPPITVSTGGVGTPPSTPAQLSGLQPWAVSGRTIIPEPSVVLLGLLGAVALLTRRRR